MLERPDLSGRSVQVSVCFYYNGNGLSSLPMYLVDKRTV